jgi:hypothetical protein
MAAFVQIVASGVGTALNPLVLTLAGGVTTTAGNMLSAQVRITAGKTLTSVTDSKGNTWHVDVQLTATGTGCAIASSILTTPLVAADTITFNFSANCSPAIGVAEFSGVGSSGGLATLDQVADLVNAAGIIVSPELASAVTAPSELAITAMGLSSTPGTCAVTAADPDSGGTWTLIAYGVPAVGGAYQLGPASLTKFKSTWTGSGGSNCEGQIATYQAASTLKSDTEVSGAGVEGAPKTGVNDAVGFP